MEKYPTAGGITYQKRAKIFSYLLHIIKNVIKTGDYTYFQKAARYFDLQLPNEADPDEAMVIGVISLNKAMLYYGFRDIYFEKFQNRYPKEKYVEYFNLYPNILNDQLKIYQVPIDFIPDDDFDAINISCALMASEFYYFYSPKIAALVL